MITLIIEVCGSQRKSKRKWRCCVNHQDSRREIHLTFILTIAPHIISPTPQNVLLDDLFMDHPLYDPSDLAREIDSYESLERALPAISQSLGEHEDLFMVQELKKNQARSSSLPTSPSSSHKATPRGSESKGKKLHRRSISDPDALRHQVFSQPYETMLDCKVPSAMDTDGLGTESILVDSFEEYKRISPNHYTYYHAMPSSGSTVVSSDESVTTERKRTSSVGRKSRTDSVTSSSTYSAGLSRSKNYACSKCGLPKKGHVCSLAPQPTKMVNMSTQVDLNTTTCERVMVVTRHYSM